MLDFHMGFSKKHILLLCTFLVNVFFFLKDAREPMDLGHYYRQLPDWIAFYEGVSTVSFLDLITTSGSWVNALWAGLITLGLTGKMSFLCFGLFWLAVFLWNIRGIKLLPMSFILMMPIWSIGTRTAWIHFIELTLFLVLWNVKKKSIPLFFVSMLLAWLRPTSLIWFLPLILLWSLLNDVKKIKALILGGALGLAIISNGLINYFFGKMNVVAIEHSLGQELMAQCFRLPLLLCVFGCVFLFRYGKRSFEDNFLMLSILLGIILSLAFRVGIDNFLVVHFSLGYLGGMGWRAFVKQKKRNNAAKTIFTDLTILIILLPLFPQRMVSWAEIPFHETIHEVKPWEVVRIQKQALRVDNLREFFDQICQEKWQENETCKIVSSHGLFHPMREEDGQLALTLAGIKQLHLANAGLWWTKQDLASPDPLQGIALFNCPSPPDQKEVFLLKENLLRELPTRVKTIKVGELPLPNCPVDFLKIEDDTLQKTLKKMVSTSENEWIMYENP